MSITNEEELEALRRIGAVVAEARDAMLAAVAPGVTTAELDDIGRRVLDHHGARSAPRETYGFPGWTCVSVNADLAHGIPSPDRVLREGDIVNVDVSAELGGFWADTGASAPVGLVAPRTRALLEATREAQQAGMQAARAGARLNRIALAVQRVARQRGFRVVAELGGHGIGRKLHEAPHVANVFSPRDTLKLTRGLVITVEPFLTCGNPRIEEASDGWTLRTVDGSLGAQFEHTMVVTDGEPIVLTRGAA